MRVLSLRHRLKPMVLKILTDIRIIIWVMAGGPKRNGSHYSAMNRAIQSSPSELRRPACIAWKAATTFLQVAMQGASTESGENNDNPQAWDRHLNL